jgi:hypothetical protein
MAVGIANGPMGSPRIPRSPFPLPASAGLSGSGAACVTAAERRVCRPPGDPQTAPALKEILDLAGRLVGLRLPEEWVIAAPRSGTPPDPSAGLAAAVSLVSAETDRPRKTGNRVFWGLSTTAGVCCPCPISSAGCSERLTRGPSKSSFPAHKKRKSAPWPPGSSACGVPFSNPALTEWPSFPSPYRDRRSLPMAKTRLGWNFFNRRANARNIDRGPMDFLLSRGPWPRCGPWPGSPWTPPPSHKPSTSWWTGGTGRSPLPFANPVRRPAPGKPPITPTPSRYKFHKNPSPRLRPSPKSAKASKANSRRTARSCL